MVTFNSKVWRKPHFCPLHFINCISGDGTTKECKKIREAFLPFCSTSFSWKLIFYFVNSIRNVKFVNNFCRCYWVFFLLAVTLFVYMNEFYFMFPNEKFTKTRVFSGCIKVRIVFTATRVFVSSLTLSTLTYYLSFFCIIVGQLWFILLRLFLPETFHCCFFKHLLTIFPTTNYLYAYFIKIDAARNMKSLK